jgi:hypothetical protein
MCIVSGRLIVAPIIQAISVVDCNARANLDLKIVYIGLGYGILTTIWLRY